MLICKARVVCVFRMMDLMAYVFSFGNAFYFQATILCNSCIFHRRLTIKVIFEPLHFFNIAIRRNKRLAATAFDILSSIVFFQLKRGAIYGLWLIRKLKQIHCPFFVLAGCPFYRFASKGKALFAIHNSRFLIDFIYIHLPPA